MLKNKKSKVKKKVLKKTKSKVKKKVLKKIEEKELVFKTKPEWIKNALVNKVKYQKKYSESIKNNNEFWKKEGKRITWIKPYKKIKNVKYSKIDVKIKWYEDGTLNASANCIDRHLKDKKDKTAIIWVGDDPKDTKKISYKQLHQQVSKAANGLKKLGIKKGDRVTIYLTMIPELAITMLACARIGAVHSIIFGGFSAESISGRVNDCESEYIITSDEGVRGGKTIPLKDTVDKALIDCAFQTNDTEALNIVFDLIEKQKIVLGGSSGINVAGAIKLAKEMGPGHNIVTILCDHGKRYASKIFNKEFLKSKNLPVPNWL